MEHQPIPTGFNSVRNALPIALVRAREALLSHFRPLIVEQGFTEQQWRVLRVVNECQPIDVTTLSDYSALHMPSVTRILKNLELDGFVTRIRDKADSRRMWVYVTPAAQKILYEAGANSEAITHRIRAHMGAEKMDMLTDLLNELAEFKAKE